MPRLEFINYQEFSKWLKKQVFTYRRPYKVYITSKDEVIAVPATSTRPNEYGLVNLSSQDEMKYLNELLKELSIDSFKINKITWSEDSAPRSE